MPTDECISCGQAELQYKTVELTGEVRGETFTVEMPGLECPACGYKTIEGPDSAEYERLLADKYRAAHGLLTSEEIRSRRNKLGISQEEFAHYVGVGVASIKRWEWGRIQDEQSNTKLVDATHPVYNLTCVGWRIAARLHRQYVRDCLLSVTSAHLESCFTSISFGKRSHLRQRCIA